MLYRRAFPNMACPGPLEPGGAHGQGRERGGELRVAENDDRLRRRRRPHQCRAAPAGARCPLQASIFLDPCVLFHTLPVMPLRYGPSASMPFSPNNTILLAPAWMMAKTQ